jgi:hypothetical protein
MSSKISVSNVPCPRCRFGGINDNFLKNREGAFFTYCDAGHQFNDTADMQAEIKASNAKFGKPAAPVVQTSVPEKPKPTPEEKKEAGAREVTAQVLVIDQENRDRIQKLLGQDIGGPAELFGAIFSMKEDLKAAQNSAPEAVPGQGPLTLKKDQIVINLPEWCAESFKDFAQGMGIPIEEFANQQFEEYLRGLYVDTVSQKTG